ncbi:bifunctional 4-hydroxy-2-oxoglutarate aldolase/2-dehydro-3-deoxy-phosphogluconate aldolase [Arthrobacter sp. zg-Y750]|uniref:bifunctional 4-hydroxy-2-oxoglutarate aldolase/2-dehydro-3-deoxy-phosphogluconate aldolase n=1 Tax=Arthrobacter sp. zg-Y750 TaxID=2894189 RepID=UPI001E46B378|nr:bifunctional 4-hydroxy-2-oxoglutarate aldolase/2-dehydro-3-deoxy-phosphogluconate aldolase [Arthrobacter sp. zg-Y750]MCC9177120.1 bifunctional 4-hydroxy-2-oxoglutarate aldolase/2-dehydro-3-deoxy-phosphogluconate aldolase [Arthrobacter sp. zg-Y750]
MTPEEFTRQLREDATLAVVRAPGIPDPAALCTALVAGGIRTVELTYTIPDALKQLRTAVDAALDHGALVGMGTVLTADQARAAIDAGAGFLVTPGLRPEVAAVAAEAGIPFSLGAMTPTEVAQAVDLGATAVKIFPARQLGPAYLKDLQGPYPGIALLPSGGIDAGNASDYLRAGAIAVCCGTSVVPPAAVAAGDWTDIQVRAAGFTGTLR